MSEKIGAMPIDLSAPGNPVVWKARWLTDPSFFRAGYRQIRSLDRIEANRTCLQNIHTLFRKIIALDNRRICCAYLYITADDTYKLYINGIFAGTGPAQSYLSSYRYNGWDVTEYLKTGAMNSLCVHAYYQGMHNYACMSADNMHGIIAQLEIRYEDGSSETIITNRTWKYMRSTARTARWVYGYETQFSEDIDMRQWESGWDKASYDDSGWQPAFVGAAPYPAVYTLVPQLTPPLEFYRAYPQRIVKTGEGRYFIDFGTEITGVTGFKATGRAGHVIEVRHGEELSSPDEVRYDMRAGCRYQEYCTLSGQPGEEIEFFEYKGFRYVEVLNWPGEMREGDLWAINQHYPFDENACRFNSSDKLLNDIWNLCRNGVRQGTQDTYLDCPTREKGGFIGDAYITGLSHLIFTGDLRIMKKFLSDCAESARLFPGILGVVPTYVDSWSADYSMLWPLLLIEYYSWSGDQAFVADMIPALNCMLEFYEQFENQDGLLENVNDLTGKKETRIMVDWPPNLRDGYDYEKAAEGVCTVVNLFYYGCLKAAGSLYKVAKDSKKMKWALQKAQKLGEQITGSLLDETCGLFIDAGGSAHHSLHASVLPLVFGLKSPGGNGALIDFIRSKRLSCGVYFAFFVLKGLYNAGEYNLAYDLITCKDERSWYNMLKWGATTCMEVWGPDQKKNTSWCHPWSSAPVYMVAMEIIGLKPEKPGWKTIRCSPRIPEKLDWAELDFTTPVGRVSAKFHRVNEQIVYELEVPDICKVVWDHGLIPEKIPDSGKYIFKWSASQG